MQAYHNAAMPRQPAGPLRPGQSETAWIAGQPWTLHLLREGLYVICELDGAGDCDSRAIYWTTTRAEWCAPWGKSPEERSHNFARAVALFTRGGAKLRLQEELQLFTIEALPAQGEV